MNGRIGRNVEIWFLLFDNVTKFFGEFFSKFEWLVGRLIG